MSLLQIAVIVICVVAVLAPISIYIMVKNHDLDAYRKRFRKTNPYIFWRDKTDDDS